MSWQFFCPTCRKSFEESDENQGVGSCRNLSCSAFGHTIRVKDLDNYQSPKVDVSEDGRTIKIEITVKL